MPFDRFSHISIAADAAWGPDAYIVTDPDGTRIERVEPPDHPAASLGMPVTAPQFPEASHG